MCYKFSKVARCKIKLQKSTAFLHTGNKLEDNSNNFYFRPLSFNLGVGEEKQEPEKPWDALDCPKRIWPQAPRTVPGAR